MPAECSPFHNHIHLADLSVGASKGVPKKGHNSVELQLDGQMGLQQPLQCLALPPALKNSVEKAGRGRKTVDHGSSATTRAKLSSDRTERERREVDFFLLMNLSGWKSNDSLDCTRNCRQAGRCGQTTWGRGRNQTAGGRKIRTTSRN